MQPKKFNTKIIFIVSILLIILDQATKLAVKGFSLFGIEHQGMYLGESYSIICDFLSITFIENAGMAFGITFGAGKIFLSLFSIIAGVAIGYYITKIQQVHIMVKIGIMLIFCGAIGNLIDRVFYGLFYNYDTIFYGNVVDFIQVNIPDINIFNRYYSHWPIFNFADSYVTIGVLTLLMFNNKIPSFSDTLKKKNQDDPVEILKEEEKSNDSN